jgi:hypothetical protein
MQQASRAADSTASEERADRPPGRAESVVLCTVRQQD